MNEPSKTPSDPYRNWVTVALALALCILSGSALLDLNSSLDKLTTLRGTQAPNVELAKRTEAQLDSLASGVKRIADSGNPNAQEIIEVLRQNGINVNSPGANAAQAEN